MKQIGNILNSDPLRLANRSFRAGLRLALRPSLLLLLCGWVRLAATLAVLAVLGVPAALGQAATTTTLALSSSSVTAETAVTFTATVSNGSPVTLGTVTFCETTTATYCFNSAIIGTAQLTAAGTAVIKRAPGIGSHTYKAVFSATTTNATSTSSAQAVTVTGLYPTATTISSTGGAGNYTLKGTVVGNGSLTLAPAGTVSFTDMSNGNYPLGSQTLGGATLTKTFPSSALATYGAGDIPTEVAVADFNNDGYLDIVAANDNSGNVTVFKGTGTGTFGAGASYGVGDSPQGIAVGDFRGIGVLDMAVAAYDDELDILLGNGDGTFQTFNPIILGNLEENNSSIVIGDFNRDGRLDIAMFNSIFVEGSYGYDAVYVFLGNGDGTFQSPISTWAGEGPEFGAVADFNGDGIPDLAVADFGTNSVGVLIGNGDGTFQSLVSYPVGTHPKGVAVGDFNGDGIPDLVVSNYGSGTLSILLGSATTRGTFGTASTLSVAGSSSSDPLNVVAANFWGDVNADVAVVYGAEYIGIFQGNGAGGFGPIEYAYTGFNPSGLAVGAFTIDGYPDLVTASTTSNDADVILNSVAETATASVSGISIPGSGAHEIKAAYADSSGFYTDGTYGDKYLTASPVSTTLGLAANPTSSGLGQSVALTATVTPSTVGNLTPSSTVTFSSNGSQIGTPQTVSGGIATLTLSTLTQGTDSLTASYAGDSNFDSSSTPVGVTGTVTFFDNTGCMGTVTLVSGVAQWTTTSLPAGTQSITASYNGDASYNGSQPSAPVLEVVDEVGNGNPGTGTGGPTSGGGAGTTGINGLPDTTTILTASVGEITVGGSVTFTATVTPVGVTGTVTFFDNGTFLGSSTATNGVAQWTTATLPAGTQSILASYNGSTSYNGSQSQSLFETVDSSAPSGNTTTTDLNASGATIPVGTAVTFYATIQSSVADTITGRVNFFDGATFIGSSLVGANGTSSLTTTTLALGSHVILAAYSGDSNQQGSRSGTVNVLVTSATSSTTTAPTITALTSSNPNIGINSPVSFTATVSSTTAGTPSGNIIFFVDDVQASTQTLIGTSLTFTTSALAAGKHEVQAVYSGDSNFAGSSNQLIETVNTAGTLETFTTVQTSNASVASGTSVTFTATVSRIAVGNPTGTVSFFNGVNFLGTQTLPVGGSGVVNMAFTLAPGTYSITAFYSGDSSFSGSSSIPVLQTVTATGTSPTSITLTTPNAVIGAGVTVVFNSALVAAGPGIPTGTVALIGDGAAVVDTAVVPASGIVVFNETTIPAGSHSYTVVYSGDAVFAGSTSLPVAFQVASAPSNTILSTATAPAAIAKIKGHAAANTAVPVTQALTAAVTSKGATVTAGRVYFYDGAAVVGSKFLNQTGTSTINQALSPGGHTLRARFSGTNKVAPSTSVASSVATIANLTSALTLGGTPGNYTLTATLIGNTVTIPAGSLNFLDQTTGTTLGTAALTTGDATTLLPQAPASPFSAGGDPVFMAGGDFNGDGFADVVIANFATGGITILLGDGTGTLTASPQSPIQIGANPTGLAIGDFSNNGRDEIAIGTDGGKVIVLVGDASGNFIPAAGSPITANSNAFIAEGDFNGDGIADLVAADSSGSGTITVLLGRGNAQFSALTPVSINFPSSIAVADFDSDGRVDLAITNAKLNQVTVLLGNGDGTFLAAAGSPYSTGNDPVYVTIADFNADGNPDIAVANNGSANATVLLGDGAGNFTPSPGSPLAAGNGPVWLVAADPDGTGAVTLAIVNAADASVTAMVGNTDGTFTTVPGSPFKSPATSLSALVMEDLTNDGRLDFLFLDRIGNQLYAELNLATVTASVSLADVSVVGTGTHTVVATYSGDTLYPSSTSNTVNLSTSATADFAVASSTATQTVTAGESATYTISVTPSNGFASAVTLTASGLPAGATAAFVPASITPSGAAVTSTLTITTAATAAAMHFPAPGNGMGIVAVSIMTLPLMGMAWLGGRRSQRGRVLRLVLLATFSMGMLFNITGCGNGSSSASSPKTYTITVTATSGSVTHSTAVTLIVD